MCTNIKIVLIFIFLISLVNPSCDKPQENREVTQVQETISKMIYLLENEEYRNVLNNFFEPEVIKDRKAKGYFEEMLNIFSGEPSKYLLDYLRKAKNINPVIDSERTTIIFTDDTFSMPLRFGNIDGKWYLFNE